MEGAASWILSKVFTKKTVEGAGAIKGKNCTIQGTSFDASGNSVITFGWTMDDGTATTSDLTVKKGVDAKQISTIVIDASDSHVKVTMDDGTILDAGEMPMEPIKVSAETGNALEKKADGLYVSTTGVEISAKEGNQISTETDGLFVPEGLKRVRLTADNDHIYKDGVVLTYEDVKTLVMNDKLFVTLIYDDSVSFLPSATDGDAIWFDGAFIYSDVVNHLRVIINKANEVKVTQLELVTAEDGKGLSTNDFTAAFKSKLNALPTNAKLTEDLGKKVNTEQGAENVGKTLIVGDDGKLILGEVATSDIGSVELNMLGWNVPSELSLKNEVAGNKFIQKIARVDLGTLDWQYRSSDGLMLCQTPLESKAIAETDAPNIYCNVYKALPRSGTESVANTDKSIALPNRYTIVHDSGYTDGTALKTAIKGTYLYYELATSIEKVIEDNELLTEVNEKIDNIYANGYASTNLLPYPYVGENALSGTKVEGGLTYTDNGDGSITINGTSTGTSYIRLNVNGGIFSGISGSMISDKGQLEIGEYTAIVSETKDNRLIVAYDPSRDLLAITANGSGQVFNNEKFYPRVVKNNVTDKSYNAYSKSNVDLTTEISRKELELAELKMLGWNVPKECPIQNEVSGSQFVQRVGRVSLVDKTWTADGIGVGGVNVFRFEIPSNCKTYSNSTKWNIYVDGYETLPLVLGYVNDVASTDKAVGGRNAGGNFIEFSTKTYSTVTDFKAYMDASGLYLYYELATPITKNIDGNENPNMVGSKLERFVAPSTDAEVLALPNGIYSINVADVGTSLFPNSWGTLVVLKSGFVYGTMLYIGANAKMYFRNINNGAWREASWTTLN